MIHIKQSKTADSRTADHVPSKEELYQSSLQHIMDVKVALGFFERKLYEAGEIHDITKLTHIDEFFDGVTKSMDGKIVYDFKQDCPWFKLHVTKERHHLHDHVPPDVTLIDVFERICDVAMAAMGRSGKMTPDMLDGELLQKAYKNTLQMLIDQIVVDPDE